MFLLIIISFQYYFLARLFHKNKLKTILSVIGLYLLANIIFAFSVVLLIGFNVLHVDFDLSKPDASAIALNEYLNKYNIPIILEITLFLILGVFYYNYLKNKWTREVLENNLKNEILAESIKASVEKGVNRMKVPSNFYYHFHKVNETNVHLVPELAKEIWNDTYPGIISQDQIDYMLNMMYNKSTILDNVQNGEHWEILKADNIPVGYIHYKDEADKVMLSKIYLKQDEKYKGVGQVLMNQVIDYANKENKKSIYLTVNKENKKAIHFYEKNGFKNIKSEVFDIGGDYKMDDYIFQKDL